MSVLTYIQGFIQAILMSGRQHKKPNPLVGLELNIHKILF